MKQRQQPYAHRTAAQQQRRRSWWQRSGSRFGLLTFALAALLILLLRRIDDVQSLSAVDLWLIVTNLVAFVMYGYDKRIAASGWTRVPERLLLLLALIGGTLGALVAMLLFRHKTAKASFRLKFLLVVLAQLLLIGLYYGWLRSNL
jgi:uncharacterized membrane protein YsdA (DUF1294 family)